MFFSLSFCLLLLVGSIDVPTSGRPMLNVAQNTFALIQICVKFTGNVSDIYLFTRLFLWQVVVCLFVCMK